MSRLVKDMITKDLADRYAGLDSALWIELAGVDGNTTNAFRGALRDQSMRVELVKNSLLRRAVADGPLKPLAEALNGPAALVTGGESLIDVAKVVEEWLPKMKGVKLKAAVLEGEFIGEDRIASLAKMPTRSELLSKVAALILTPGGNIAAAALSGGQNIAGAIKTLIEKLEDGESEPEAVAVAETGAEAESKSEEVDAPSA